MKLHNIERIPDGLIYEHGEVSKFEDYEIEKLEKHGIDEAWYWYTQGSYEGSGQLLMMKDGRFFVHDCGHCSCYGPTEHIELKSGYASLSDLISSCTEEALKEIKPLIEMAQSQGYA